MLEKSLKEKEDGMDEGKQKTVLEHPYSLHTFFFVFKWERVSKSQGLFKQLNFEGKFDLTNFESQLNCQNNILNKLGMKWERRQFELNNKYYKKGGDNVTYKKYSEYNYFYDFVRPSIYDLNKNLFSITEKLSGNNQYEILQHYELHIPNEIKAKYKIRKEKNKWENENTPKDKFFEYILSVDDIILNVYKTGVAIITFHLENWETNDENDILKINQFGRRITPPFISSKGLKSVKGSELADEVGLQFFKEDSCIESLIENFERNDETPKLYLNNKIEKPFLLPIFIRALLPNCNFFDSYEEIHKEGIFIYPVIDDRMFVLSWYGNTTIASKLTRKSDLSIIKAKNLQRSEWEIYPETVNYEDDEYWYKYLFIDSGLKTCQNDKMTQEMLKKHGYYRWSNFNTFYGVSRYSFVCITNDYEKLKKDGAGYIPNHIRSMYYKMVELSLIQRASILRFSDEVTEVSTLKPEEGLIERIDDLYKNYIRFINKIYFREITAQEQGIELYNLIQQHFNLERDVKDLDNEIQELYNYALLYEQQESQKAINRITILGALFFIPTFILSYYGTNIFDENLITLNKQGIKLIIISLGVIMVLSVFIFKSSKIKNNLSTFKKYTLLIMFLVMIFLIVLPLSPYFKKSEEENKSERSFEDNRVIKLMEKQNQIIKNNTDIINELKIVLENDTLNPKLQTNE